jgi:predicted GTPase
MSDTREPARVVIMAASGRDFHNFKMGWLPSSRLT